jgi:hypothetical protein
MNPLISSGAAKNHVGAVAHHPRRHDRRSAFLRTIVTNISLEAQISFPERTWG